MVDKWWTDLEEFKTEVVFNCLWVQFEDELNHLRAQFEDEYNCLRPQIEDEFNRLKSQIEDGFNFLWTQIEDELNSLWSQIENEHNSQFDWKWTQKFLILETNLRTKWLKSFESILTLTLQCRIWSNP